MHLSKRRASYTDSLKVIRVSEPLDLYAGCSLDHAAQVHPGGKRVIDDKRGDGSGCVPGFSALVALSLYYDLFRRNCLLFCLGRKNKCER